MLTTQVDVRLHVSVSYSFVKEPIKVMLLLKCVRVIENSVKFKITITQNYSQIIITYESVKSSGKWLSPPVDIYSNQLSPTSFRLSRNVQDFSFKVSSRVSVEIHSNSSTYYSESIIRLGLQAVTLSRFCEYDKLHFTIKRIKLKSE